MSSPRLFIDELPDGLRDGVRRQLERLDETAPSITDVLDGAVLARVLATSLYAGEVLVRYPDLILELSRSGRLARASEPGELADAIRGALNGPADGARDGALDGGVGDGDFDSALRRFRHRELFRIVWRDQSGDADVTESLHDLSELADAAINAVLERSRAELVTRHGAPRCADGSECGFGVLAMGKLGGHELNFSSDVDLVFVYTDGGETDGARPLSNEEYFRRLAQRIVDLLSRKTADGFVYRVDVRLRPFGTAGALAVSLPSLENYLLQNGRDWERYAYVKARVVNEWDAAAELYRNVLRPFVYRRYLDYGVFGSLRDMKALIEAEVARKEFRTNLKLGPGGIREIEFIVQVLQLVRGGTVVELRERQLLEVLPRLVRVGCLPEGDARELESAYRFLRLAENRLQAINDRQTHDLPDDTADRARLATAMGFSDWDALTVELRRHREAVAKHFRSVVFRGAPAAEPSPAGPALASVWLEENAGAEVHAARLAEAGFADPPGALERIRRLREGGLAARLDEPGRKRLDALVPAVLERAGREKEAGRALDGMVLILEAIGRRSAYFALLNENPMALERLVSLCATSEFLARLVAAHPLLLDELLDPRMLEQAPTRTELETDLSVRLARVPDEDIEARLDALRNFQQAAVFRVACVDLAGVLPLMKVSDRLTDIAELVLDAALGIAWAEMTARHGEPSCVVDGTVRPARFAIVGYGKLGGLELGYGSDLDLVFLHDSVGDNENAVFFARLARRIISILTMHTSSGKLYEVDIRLRPSGQSGLLVSSLEAFDRYQQQDAWTWEHQALLRSRGVAGDPAVREAFEHLRVRALTRYVRQDGLAGEVAEMRQRMRSELSRGTDTLFDVKQDAGGIADIEFMVQYLVLREAPAFPDVVRWSDNIRQLEALAAHDVLPAVDAALLADTYRWYRQKLHRLSLAGDAALLPREECAQAIEAVVGAWRRVFYTAGPVPVNTDP